MLRRANRPRKALLVGGGWPGHQPWECLELFGEFLAQEGYEILRSDDLSVYGDRSVMNSVRVTVQSWTMGDIAPDHAAGLIKAVETGMGLAGWHGGLGDAFRQSTKYQFLVGGQFVAHPGGKRRYRVEIVQPDDPIVRGLSDFEIRSEQYYMHVDPAIEVLARTTFDRRPFPWLEGVHMPVIWKRRWGDGRVFYCSVGHDLKDFKKCETLRELVRRGILWAAGELA